MWASCHLLQAALDPGTWLSMVPDMVGMPMLVSATGPSRPWGPAQMENCLGMDPWINLA